MRSNETFDALHDQITNTALGEHDTLVIMSENVPRRLVAAHISDCGWVDIFIADGQIRDQTTLRHVGMTPSQFRQLRDDYASWEATREADQADDIEARMQERIDEQGDQDYFNSIDFQHDQDERED